MTFEDIIGNEALVRALEGMVESGRVPHAMLFYENDGGGALALVNAFVSCLNKGEKADVHYSFPITSGNKVTGKVQDLTCDMFSKYWRELTEENPYFLESELSSALGFEKKTGSITVAEGKAILQKLSLASMTEGYRAMVIYLPERMNQSTANMLLKAIEEPAPDNIFLLITHAPENVLQTISSRCQAVRLMPLSKEEVARTLVEKFGVRGEDAVSLAASSGGSIGVALHNLAERSESAEMKDLFVSLMEAVTERNYLAALEIGESVAALDSREKQKAFCNFAGDCIRKIFLVQQNMTEIAGIMPEETAFYEALAAKCGKSFCRHAAEAVGRAASLVDRNVNQKIVMCNMVGRIFISV